MEGEPNAEGTPPPSGDPPIDADEAKETPDETPGTEPQGTNENEDAPNGESSPHEDQEETKGESPDDANIEGDPPGSDHEQSKEGSQAEGSKDDDPDHERPQDNEDEMEEESKEEDPYAKAAKDDRCIWMVSKIVDDLTDFKFDQMWKPEHYSWILDFLNPKMDISKLFAWVQNDKEILFTNAGKPTVEGDINQFQMVYFIKRKFGEEITMKTINEDVYVDVMNGDALDDLLNKMNTDYLNQFLADRSWPEGIRKDFIGGLHKFMAALTEAAYMSRGKTQLYIPKEDLHDIDKALEDRELIQRLESTLIFWTRQIKEVVSNQESQQNNENISSPLEEIDHWATRTYNLGDLNKQLKEDDLKRICEVLGAGESSYLASFKELEAQIHEGSLEAADNLKYLKILAEPCKKIESSEPKAIPQLLPKVLKCVRLIFEMSTHYWSEERMKGLLTKISNQIIKRCRAKINTHDMLEGDVDKCMRDLDESIECCNEWKRICTESQKTIIKYSNNPDRKWKLDSDETIFAENEAFIQRCKDCKDICEGQLQFARKGEGITLPKFGGSKGPEIKKNLDELQGMFQRYLEDIKDLDYDILDVKKTKWHDDYGQKFKENQKSLEIIYRNTVLHAFKNITTVTEGAEMLENFHQLAKRQLVKEYINTKAAEHVYKLFIDEMKEVEEMYENSTKNYYLPMPPSHPKFAGLAIWALSLIIRIDRAKKDIDTLFFIPHLPMRDEAIEKYRKLKDALDSFITKTQFEDNWTREITEKLDIANIDDKLKTPLLIRTDEAKGTLPDAVRNNPIFTKSKDGECLESNFDKTLLKTLSEGTYWTKLHALGMVTVNHAVTKLLSQKENLRKMRENVMLIVREYNRIIESITPEQKKVFKQHLENLDQIISYGMSRFKWNNNSNSFLLNSRANCIELFRMVKKFQKNEKIINKECEIISRTTLTKIGKELYGLDKFLKDQEAQLKKNEEKFKASFDKIGKFIIDTYQIFFYQHDEIQLNFLNYVAKLDKKIFSSLKGSIKNTILDLSKHIKGENKKSDEVQAFVPLFKVYNLINPNEKNITIIHDPSAEELKDAINGFILKIILVSKAIPNLEKVFRELRDGFLNQKKEEIWQEGHHGSDYKKSSGYNKNSGSSYPSFFDEFKDPNLTDEEKLEKWEKRWTLPAPYHEKDSSYKRLEKDNSLKSKTSGILDAIEEAKTLFSDQSQYWTKNDFKTIYNFSKNKKRASAFKNTIESDPLDSFKVLIDTVGTNIDQISGEPPQKPELFIQFDNTKMIESFQEIGYDHINEIYKMIVDEARGELDSLYNTFEHVSRELNTDTEDLKALKDKQELYEKIMNEREELKGRIEPIQRKFDYLKGKNQDHQLTEQEHLKLKNVYEAWDNFEKALHDGKQMVSKIQKKLKQGVDDDMEDFKKAVEDNKKQFQDNAPYSCDKIDNSEARDKIRESKKTTAELREREEEMKFGLDIFNIDHPVYPELSFVEKECKLLESIWDIKEDWDSKWSDWKDTKFDQIDSNEMNDEAQEFSDKLKEVNREIRNWQIYDFLKNKIESFLQTMPLIGELRNEAIRGRHWKQLRIEVSNDFDEKADDFTLEKVFDLQLNQHNEFIQELCTNASKELTIENQLDMIEYTWTKDPKTDLILKKETSKGSTEEYYKVVTAENIYQVIEDHVVILSNNKSGAFYKQFEEQIDTWEDNLAQISETLEMLMIVQSKWGYLESIFTGQQDIMKQLSQEHTVFQGVNAGFKEEMERIFKIKNAKESLIVKGLDKKLEEMDEKLEHIQKNLDDYLKLKRQNFPRFFFLSNEDLLEIMGQSKNPTPMNKHVKK